MSVKPLPQPKKLNQEINDFVNRGADVKESSSGKSDWKVMTLRLPQELLEKIEENQKQLLGMTRNATILKLIQDGLNQKS